MKKLFLLISLLFYAATAHAQFDNNTSPLRVCHAQYSFAVDGGGAPGLITPANNCTIPGNAMVISCSINSTTAFTGATNTTSVGLSAGGGSATSLIAATAVASWTTNAKLQCVPVPNTASTWVKLTAPAVITLTSATAALTAGIAEIYVIYFVSATP